MRLVLWPKIMFKCKIKKKNHSHTHTLSLSFTHPLFFFLLPTPTHPVGFTINDQSLMPRNIPHHTPRLLCQNSQHSQHGLQHAFQSQPKQYKWFQSWHTCKFGFLLRKINHFERHTGKFIPVSALPADTENNVFDVKLQYRPHTHVCFNYPHGNNLRHKLAFLAWLPIATNTPST